jgi:glycerol-3-phosphate dehydrogenase subunit B
LNTIDCELAVIGAGMAGMAAALFAASRGLQVVQIGRPLGFTYASGLLDLMAVHPVADGKTWENPWACIEALVEEIPRHPYARLAKDDIHSALTELDSFLNAAGISYHDKGGLNADLITAAGTVKKTFKIPQTMWPGVAALENRQPCLLVDFQGLREFSARQIASVCQKRWPNLHAIQLPFPGNVAGREIITGEISARTIARPENLETLARAIRPHIRDATAVGVPAMMGLNGAERIVCNLENQLGAAVFEIPTAPPSVPGLRLLEAFSRRLPLHGVRQLLAHQVLAVKPHPNGDFLLQVGSGVADQLVRSRGIILATGRFLANGLQADRLRIREVLFDLPVVQPQERTQWHRMDFFDARGHLVNRAGLEVDGSFRPLDAAGRPAFERLHAAGSILAHQDWMRMKCGAGLAVATAFGAVKAFAAAGN